MGCVSSKLVKAEMKQDILLCNGECTDHVVSLISSTYGVLKIDRENPYENSVKMMVSEPEIIDAIELMGDLSGEIPRSCSDLKRTTKLQIEERSFSTPLKLMSRIESTKESKIFAGKENMDQQCFFDGPRRSESTPKRALRDLSSFQNTQDPLDFTPQIKCFPEEIGFTDSMTRSKTTPERKSMGTPRHLINVLNSTEERRYSDSKITPNTVKSKCFSPLFDPELLVFLETEYFDEGEQIKKKKIISPKSLTKKSQDSASKLSLFELGPPGGENAVVIYTTTLRGIRKTFEDCNRVRSVIEACNIRLIERDISMDSGYREELRRLMGRKDVRIPVVFVRGKLIGGLDEILKLDEDGRLENLFKGIPKGSIWCERCRGVRFVVCMTCNGSCKVMDHQKKKTVRCGECNENGLIHCSVCY